MVLLNNRRGRYPLADNRTSIALMSLLSFPVLWAQSIEPGGVQWLTPSDGTSLVPGGSLIATWKSDIPLDTPSFALCTSTNQCGQESWPTVTHNEDGSSTAHLSLPPMPDMQGLFLKMNPGNDMGIPETTSPVFDVSLAVDPQASAQAASQASTIVVSVNPYYTGAATSPTSTKTKGRASDMSTATGNEDAMTSTEPLSTQSAHIPTTTPPNPYYTAQTNQYPLIPTSQSGFSISSMTIPTVLMTTSPLPISQADTESPASRPSAVAIAVPLSICGLIALSALIFCARSKVFRAPAQDPEKDWEGIVKAKAAAGAPPGPGAGSANGVTITQRDAPPGEFTILPTLGYASQPPSINPGGCSGQPHTQAAGPYQSYRLSDQQASQHFDVRRSSSSRCLTPIREAGYFTSIPPIDYFRRSSRSRYGYDDRERERDYERYRERERRHSREDDYRCDDIGQREYYTTSRRSSSSMDGHSNCSCQHHQPLDRYFKRPEPMRMSSGISDKSGGSIVNPHPRSPLPSIPYGHYSGSNLSSGRSRSRSRSRSRDGPLRPLPDPIIRSSSGSGSEGRYGSSYTRGQPHRTGVLERGGSSTSSAAGMWGEPRKSYNGWEDERQYGGSELERGSGQGLRVREEDSMEGLYESLRKAIGTPRQ